VSRAHFGLYAGFTPAPPTPHSALTGFGAIFLGRLLERIPMFDVIFIGLGLAFFVAMGFYLFACERA
jgi:hypothetical protein